MSAAKLILFFYRSKATTGSDFCNAVRKKYNSSCEHLIYLEIR
jgi:hypothetical protein